MRRSIRARQRFARLSRAAQRFSFEDIDDLPSLPVETVREIAVRASILDVFRMKAGEARAAFGITDTWVGDAVSDIGIV